MRGRFTREALEPLTRCGQHNLAPGGLHALWRRRDHRLHGGSKSSNVGSGGHVPHPIQIILARQLAGYLSVPLFLVDPRGTLIFYNEPAEVILGKRFDETGAMAAEEWSSAFLPIDEKGEPIPPEELPLRITLSRQRPAYRRLRIRGLDGVLRSLEVAAIPIAGLEGEFLGAAALFWELTE
jgi:PAS domain-containing protein